MSERSPVVLVVEDEKQIRQFVRTALEQEGCRVYEAGTSAQGLIEASRQKLDLLVLDLGLPDGNGIDFISALRGWSDAPILVLSARTRERDKVLALDVGADDYLTKPFGVAELRARARALLRRRNRSGDSGKQFVEFGDVQIDLARRIVSKAGVPVHITLIEYRLLCVFLANIGKVLTQRHLLSEVWGTSSLESNHYVRVYVAHLRQKLEDDPAQPKHIRTETGVGYRFQP